MLRRFRPAALAALILLGGCASVSRPPYGTPHPGEQPTAPAPASPYVPEPGRDAATIAEMRAAPPAEPVLETGRSAAGDSKRLAARSFVRVGSARYGGSEDGVRDAADRQARAVGADRVLIYAPDADAPDWNAVFYVRFKLPFGATFRDLTAAERTTLGSDGVEIGSVVGGTPASRANLLAGDFVVRVNGRAIAGRSAFQNELRANAGRSVMLTIVRNGETLQRAVKLGAVPGPAGP